MREQEIEVVFFEELTFCVRVGIAPAEPDVGIMSPSLEEWQITSVEGTTSPAVCEFFHILIENDKKFLSRWLDTLHEELE